MPTAPHPDSRRVPREDALADERSHRPGRLSAHRLSRDVIAVSKEVAGTRQDFGAHLEMIGVLLTDLIYLKEGYGEHVINFDIQDRLGNLAERISTSHLIKLTEFLGVMEGSLKTHVNRPMLTEVLALSGNVSLSKILDDIPMRSR